MRSATTILEPESASIRASSGTTEPGFTGTATAWARSTPRYAVTNSRPLPVATMTRWPASTPGPPQPGGEARDGVVEPGPGGAAATRLDDRRGVGVGARGRGDEVGDVGDRGALGHARDPSTASAARRRPAHPAMARLPT